MASTDCYSHQHTSESKTRNSSRVVKNMEFLAGGVKKSRPIGQFDKSVGRKFVIYFLLFHHAKDRI